MTGVERRPPPSIPIPLEVDPGKSILRIFDLIYLCTFILVSILSLSKGEIFDTIVHNIECTLSKRHNEPLPWKLTGMSLICDPNRNKKYMQKLQKMQVSKELILFVYSEGN